MCFGGRPKLPPPPPLAPSPPPPSKPVTPAPAPKPIGTEMDPQVRRAKSKKDKNPFSKGTGSLRINIDPQVNTGGEGPSGGLNQ